MASAAHPSDRTPQHCTDARARLIGVSPSRVSISPLPRHSAARWAINRPRSFAELDRLERIRVLLTQRSHAAAAARLLLFSRTSFTNGLREAARTRADIELVDLTRLYTGD